MADRELIRALRAEGVTYAEIEQRLGITKTTIYYALHPEKLRDTNAKRQKAKAEWQRQKNARLRALLPPKPEPPRGKLPLRNRAGEIVAYTLVDDEDWEKYKHRSWSLNAQGYARASINGRSTPLHRLIVGLEHGENWQLRQTDHINRDRLDNRRANLRIVTQYENNQNRGGIFEKPRGGA